MPHQLKQGTLCQAGDSWIVKDILNDTIHYVQCFGVMTLVEKAPVVKDEATERIKFMSVWDTLGFNYGQVELSDVYLGWQMAKGLLG